MIFLSFFDENSKNSPKILKIPPKFRKPMNQSRQQLQQRRKFQKFAKNSENSPKIRRKFLKKKVFFEALISYRIVSYRERKPSYRIDIVSSRKKAYRSSLITIVLITFSILSLRNSMCPTCRYHTLSKRRHASLSPWILVGFSSPPKARISCRTGTLTEKHMASCTPSLYSCW